MKLLGLATSAGLAVPREATEDGVLDLRWELVNVVRGCQVAEVWLIQAPG